MDSQLRIASAVGLLLTLLLAAGLWLVLSAPEAAPAPAPLRVSPKPRPAPKVANPMARVALPPPADVERPPPERRPPGTTKIGPEEFQAYNIAVEDVLREARVDCIEPWLEDTDPSGSLEIIFDVVLWDGEVADFGVRGLGDGVPTHVLDCVADRAWAVEFPRQDLTGELRLQRAIDVSAH